MKKMTIAIVFLLLFGSFLIPPTAVSADEWIIDGDKVYFEDSRVYLSATPHTLGSSGYVEFELNSKIYSGDIDLIWGFDSTNAKPTRPDIWTSFPHYEDQWFWRNGTYDHYIENVSSSTNLGIENYSNYTVKYGNMNNSKLYNLVFSDGTTSFNIAFNTVDQDDQNGTFHYYFDQIYKESVNVGTYEDWKTISNTPQIIDYQFRDANKWYLYKNVNVNAGQTYKIRTWIDVPFSPTAVEGKYWWAIKPSGLSLSQAISQDKLYFLDPWWDINWDFYVPIRIESDYINNTLTNFPILVRVDAATSAKCDNGKSVRFLDIDNATVYYHEIEGTWNATGENICWVNISSIPSDSDFTFLMYYGNAGASSTSDPYNTFSNGFDAVYHMSEGATVTDSAGASPGGYENSTATTGAPVLNVGIIGNGTYFADSPDYYALGDVLDLGSPQYSDPVEFTFTYWIKYGRAFDGTDSGIWMKNWDPTHQGTIITYDIDGAREYKYYFPLPDGLPQQGTWATAGVEQYWNFVTIRWASASTHLESARNRSQDTRNNAIVMTNTSSYGYVQAYLAREYSGDRAWFGDIDEFRLSIGVARNDDWLDAEYNMTVAPDFLTIGAEQNNIPPRFWLGVGNWNVSLYNVSAWQGDSTAREWFDGVLNSNFKIHGARYISQNFMLGYTGPNTDFYLTGVNLSLARVAGHYPGMIYVSINLTDAHGTPTSTSISNGTLDSMLVGTPNDNYHIPMSSVILSPGVRYAIVARAPYGDATNLVYTYQCNNVTVPASASYPGGFANSSTDSGATWADGSTIDRIFWILGTEVHTVWSVQVLNNSYFRDVANWTVAVTGIAIWRNRTTDPRVYWEGVSLYNDSIQYLNITIEGFGTVTQSPSAPYHLGDVVTLTAVPTVNTYFYRWLGDLTGSDNPDTITIDSDKNVIANFTFTPMFTYTDNDTEIPDLTDVIDPGTGLFNWARIFTEAWTWAFGGWFLAMILGVIGGGLYLKANRPELSIAYFIIILILFASVTQSIAYVVTILIALVIGFLLYKVITGRRDEDV